MSLSLSHRELPNAVGSIHLTQMERNVPKLILSTDLIKDYCHMKWYYLQKLTNTSFRRNVSVCPTFYLWNHITDASLTQRCLPNGPTMSSEWARSYVNNMMPKVPWILIMQGKKDEFLFGSWCSTLMMDCQWEQVGIEGHWPDRNVREQAVLGNLMFELQW